MSDNRHQVVEREITYVHELPELARLLLCYNLNLENSWKLLLALIYDEEEEDQRYKSEQVEEVARCAKTSPPAELLKLLVDRNFSLELLYVALASLNFRSAMRVLDEYVSEDFKNSHLFSMPNEECLSIAPSRIENARIIETVTLNPNHSSHIEDISSNTATPENICDSPQQVKESIKPAYCSRGENVVSYRELIQATNDWSSENCLDPKRNVNFYRGRLGGRDVAIKKLAPHQGDQELEEIRKFRSESKGHTYILNMLMFVEGNGNLCMVFPFMEIGSLYDYINQTATEENGLDPNFSSQKQSEIAFGIADALSYLHFQVFKSAVVVKSSDILLGESMTPRVADVTLPSMMIKPSTPLSLYIPQSGYNGKDEDLFCFGTIVIELSKGQTADKLPDHPEIWFKKNSKEITQLERKALITVCYQHSLYEDFNISNISNCLWTT